MIFDDRNSAGVRLSEKLHFTDGDRVIVMGLARGGIVVAAAISKMLKLPLDVLVVKKISAPSEPELAIGALAPDNVSFIDWKFAGRLGADSDYISKQTQDTGQEIRQKSFLYRKGRKPYDIRDRTVVLVDDGVATGATFEAAIKWARKKHARTIVACIPVMPEDAMSKIRPEVNSLIVLDTPKTFTAVGQFYKDFPQVEDSEVIELLRST